MTNPRVDDALARFENGRPMWQVVRDLKPLDLAAILEELKEARASRWIPVSERVPESPTIGVFVWHKSGVFSLASWYGNREPHECLADEQCGWRQWRVWQVLHPDYGGGIHGNEPGDEITHWQPLPEPPKE